MELYITVKWAYSCKTKDWHAYPYFCIIVIKSCQVDLGVRSEGGLGACVIPVILNLNRGRRHSRVKLKRGNVEVNFDSIMSKLTEVGHCWFGTMVLGTHGIGVVRAYKEFVHTPL